MFLVGTAARIDVGLGRCVAPIVVHGLATDLSNNPVMRPMSRTWISSPKLEAKEETGPRMESEIRVASNLKVTVPSWGSFWTCSPLRYVPCGEFLMGKVRANGESLKKRRPEYTRMTSRGGKTRLYLSYRRYPSGPRTHIFSSLSFFSICSSISTCAGQDVYEAAEHLTKLQAEATEGEKLRKFRWGEVAGGYIPRSCSLQDSPASENDRIVMRFPGTQGNGI